MSESKQSNPAVAVAVPSSAERLQDFLENHPERHVGNLIENASKLGMSAMEYFIALASQ